MLLKFEIWVTNQLQKVTCCRGRPFSEANASEDAAAPLPQDVAGEAPPKANCKSAAQPTPHQGDQQAPQSEQTSTGLKVTNVSCSEDSRPYTLPGQGTAWGRLTSYTAAEQTSAHKLYAMFCNKSKPCFVASIRDLNLAAEVGRSHISKTQINALVLQLAVFWTCHGKSRETNGKVILWGSQRS